MQHCANMGEPPQVVRVLDGGAGAPDGAPMTALSETPMERALAEAAAAAGRGEVPVGAAVVDGASGELLAAAARSLAPFQWSFKEPPRYV